MQFLRYTPEQAQENANRIESKPMVVIIDDPEKGVSRTLEWAISKGLTPEQAKAGFVGIPQILRLADFELEIDHGDKRSSKFVYETDEVLIVAWAFKSKQASGTYPAGQAAYSLALAREYADANPATSESGSGY